MQSRARSEPSDGRPRCSLHVLRPLSVLEDQTETPAEQTLASVLRQFRRPRGLPAVSARQSGYVQRLGAAGAYAYEAEEHLTGQRGV